MEKVPTCLPTEPRGQLERKVVHFQWFWKEWAELSYYDNQEIIRPDYSENQEIIHQIIKSKCLKFKSKCLKTLALKMKVKSLSRVQLFATPWTVAYQALTSMGFSRQECWNGLPFPSPGDLPNPGIEPRPPEVQADTLPSEPPGNPSNKLWLL